MKTIIKRKKRKKKILFRIVLNAFKLLKNKIYSNYIEWGKRKNTK